MRISRRSLFLGSVASILGTRTSRSNSLTFDLVVYGATSGGIAAAYEAKRQGRSVALVGGWRETHLGGMMSGGLGYSDLDTPWICGGLARRVIDSINRLAGQSPGTFAFQPRFAELAFRELIEQLDIPVFWSFGVKDVRKQDGIITDITTTLGQTFSARVFIDASYEGDLMHLAGVRNFIGREAKSSTDLYNGYRGTDGEGGGFNHNFVKRRSFLKFLADRQVMVDPHIQSGNPSSGLLHGIRPYPSTPLFGVDCGVQAYNFRLTMTRNPKLSASLSSAPPAGYYKDNYEILFRYISALSANGMLRSSDNIVEENFLLCNPIGGGLLDVNNWGAVSTDYIGGSWAYPAADYTQREIIWKSHERWIRGLFYAIQYEQDARIPDYLRSCMQSFGLANNHYLDPSPGDEKFWPYQLYVREARRMTSDFVLHGADIALQNGAKPRSQKTISAGSYKRDSHHAQRIAVESPIWHVTNEGNFEVDNGGPSKIFPIPYEVTVPRRSECRNLLVAFCISATHEAFGAFRMEMTLMQLGQSLGMAAAIIAEHRSNLDVQDVPYEELRSRLARTPEQVKPQLPQVS